MEKKNIIWILAGIAALVLIIIVIIIVVLKTKSVDTKVVSGK